MKTKKYFIDLSNKFSPKMGNKNYQKYLARQNNKNVGFFNIIDFIKKDFKKEVNSVRTIPFGDMAFPKKLIDNKKKNWRPTEETFNKSEIITHNLGRYSSRCWYTKFVYQRLVQSWGYLVSDKYLFIQYDSPVGIKRKIIKASKGWKWGIDNSGIGIFGPNGEDYHPSISDLVNKKQKEYLDIARQNLKIRKKEKAKTKESESLLKLLSKRQSFIYLGDSLSVGNCVNGTTFFAKKVLNADKPYIEASKLKLNDHPSMPLVIKKAYYREQKELQKGFCSIPYMKEGKDEND